MVAALAAIVLSPGLKPTWESLFNALSVLVVTAVSVAFLLAIDIQAHSVELSAEGVSALTWQKRASPVFVRLTRTFVPWRDIQRIGVKGFVVHLASATQVIQVNAYLFAEPDAVLPFIKTCVERSNPPLNTDAPPIGGAPVS